MDQSNEVNSEDFVLVNDELAAFSFPDEHLIWVLVILQLVQPWTIIAVGKVSIGAFIFVAVIVDKYISIAIPEYRACIFV